MLRSWLETLPQAELAAVLASRRDVLTAPTPRDVSELADRLQHTNSVANAVRQLSAPSLQAIVALLALGSQRTPETLIDFLDDPSGDSARHEQDVADALADLRTRALVWPGPDGRLHLPGALRRLLPDPLGLGPAARALLSERGTDELRRIQSQLRLPRAQTKSAMVTGIVGFLSDAQAVRHLVATLPAATRDMLARRAEIDESDEPLFISGPRRGTAAEAPALERGLLVMQNWAPTRMPAEVARALRGPDYRAPFQPRPPAVELRDIGAQLVESEAATAAIQFVEHATAILDLVARQPAPCLKSGGLGGREISRLGKLAGVGDDTVRLVLELARAAGLLAIANGQVSAATSHAAWRDGEPALRLHPLLIAWWQLAATPTVTRDEDGKLLPALVRRPSCDGCLAGRHALVSGLVDLPPGRALPDAEAAVACAAWHRPFIHLPSAGNGQPPHAWQEAIVLGVIARSAASSLARALRTDAPQSVDGAVHALLPASAQSAIFGSDLTVVVSGSPAARMRTLLDACAEREARSAASVWRFTPASVRRAMDEGLTAADLERRLAELATGPLPQPLRYLLGDVARRHGHLRVSTAVSCIQSDDEALLAEVAANRKLAKLNPRLIAPTVLATSAPVRQALAVLREGGYLPVSEDPSGAIRLEPGGDPAPAGAVRPIVPVRRTQQFADPDEVAASLLQAGPSAAAAERTVTEKRVAEWANSLDDAEIRQLAHAIDHDQPVQIEYVSTGGGWTSRVVSQLEFTPPYLAAWCHLRDGERVFTLSRIQSVSAV